MAYPAGVALWNARKKTPQIHMGGNGVVVLWPLFSRKDFCVMTIDTCRSHAITKLMEQSGWNQICGMMFYSYMNLPDDPDELPRKDDSGQFEDALEPPNTPAPQISRLRCPRRNARARSTGPIMRDSFSI